MKIGLLGMFLWVGVCSSVSALQRVICDRCGNTVRRTTMNTPRAVQHSVRTSKLHSHEGDPSSLGATGGGKRHEAKGCDRDVKQPQQNRHLHEGDPSSLGATGGGKQHKTKECDRDVKKPQQKLRPLEEFRKPNAIMRFWSRVEELEEDDAQEWTEWFYQISDDPSYEIESMMKWKDGLFNRGRRRARY